MMRTGWWGALVMATAFGTGAAAAGEVAAPADRPVLELRQYKIVHGRRDAFIDLFEANFVESQEALGMRLVGQFRDRDDPDRFTWLRAFPSMAAREKALNAFYFGPVWQAKRGEANPMLDDNDNVLLLRPAAPQWAFAPPRGERAGPRDPAPPKGVVIATIEYLWKTPAEGFTAFFSDRMAPALKAAGLPVLAAYVPEEAENNFPRLPIRREAKLLVWFARADSLAAYDEAMRRLWSEPAWRHSDAARLADYEERAPQMLRLDPTPRSRLR